MSLCLRLGIAFAFCITYTIYLQVVSNDAYETVEHRVVIKSANEPRVSIALFFNPANHGKSRRSPPGAGDARKTCKVPEFNLAENAEEEKGLGARQAIVT